MKKFITMILLLSLCSFMSAQTKESWEVTVNEMNSATREIITRTVEELQSQGGATRSVLAGMALSAGQAGAAALVDITATEVVRLANLRKTQKQEWLTMIKNECNYKDSITSIKGLNDFYSETSRLGAMDPSSMNFDGFKVQGIRDGREILFLSCHIDTTRMEHLYQHSKFCLVVDTISFHPYECHLPNLRANGIYLKPGETTERDNTFSYNERENLTVGMEISISSSWINEAITVQRDVELGHFNMSVSIPSGTEVYSYSRAAIDRNRQLVAEGMAPDGEQLDTVYVALNGDCFVVPRSYMPINGNDSMWGTGEYTIKVIFSESCQFSQDATRNDKMKHWAQDYRRLKKMQKKGSEFSSYLSTLWVQNGNTLMKTMVKSGLATGAKETGLTK